MFILSFICYPNQCRASNVDHYSNKSKNIYFLCEPSWSKILKFLYFQQKTLKVPTKIIMYLNNVNRNSDLLFSHHFLRLLSTSLSISKSSSNEGSNKISSIKSGKAVRNRYLSIVIPILKSRYRHIK